MSGNLKNKKVGVVLFNLGGPSDKKSIKPFLFNLFFDKHIINLPKFLRYFIARFISSKREKTAQEIYSYIGYKSPLLVETQNQAKFLEKSLNDNSNYHYKVFVSMRYWHPMANEVIQNIKKNNFDKIVLLPLYPQFSTTTSFSSIEDFLERSKKVIKKPVYKTICCYPKDLSFIKSHVELIIKALGKIKNKDNYRILFSAHSLPKKIIDSGDPYQWQVKTTVKAIIANLPNSNIDYRICYQSKVGFLEWLGPSTEDEIEKAGKEKKELIIVPVAFVSEHSETLVELDIEYKLVAEKYFINYIRVPTLGINNYFMESLQKIIINSENYDSSFIHSSEMKRICPQSYTKCPCEK